MWLSQKLREQKAENGAGEFGIVTIEGGAPAVLVRAEERELAVLAPGGYHWRPRSGEAVLVLKGGEQGTERYLLGCAQQEDEVLQPGEVCISSGAAGIRLHTDGRIELTGRLYINGVACMPGEET